MRRSGRAAQCTVTNPASALRSGHFFFLLLSSASVRSPVLLTCLHAYSKPLACATPSSFFFFPRRLSCRSAAPKPMGVKADGWMDANGIGLASLVVASDFRLRTPSLACSRRGDISTPSIIPLSPNGLGGFAVFVVIINREVSVASRKFISDLKLSKSKTKKKTNKQKVVQLIATSSQSRLSSDSHSISYLKHQTSKPKRRHLPRTRFADGGVASPPPFNSSHHCEHRSRLRFPLWGSLL